METEHRNQTELCKNGASPSCSNMGLFLRNKEKASDIGHELHSPFFVPCYMQL